ncbi:MAG: Gfo/Idh/MocA family oxidoreductase [Bryobacterales bacterium]|nr:Gfo/Idh/MocA family oxidoreductase [Bryobacteraceae bacterium]MDW8354850.1 Gfo/Idh/MocA family oxidoreductase [Bryobacterales bacterium]
MKIGVVGLGFMGSTHLRALRNVAQAELHAVVSSDPRKLEGDLSGIQGNIGGPGERFDFTGVRKYRTWQEAVADPELEALDICLPTHLHAEVAIAALRAGKHVLVEKPMALDGASAEAMLAAARESGRVLMTAHVLRFWPDYVVLSDTVKSGRIGSVRAAVFRRRCAAPAWGAWLSDKQASGGGVFDLLIHDVDFCLHLFGAPEAVSAVGYEDMAHGIDWITAQLHYSGIGGVVISGGWHHAGAFPFSMEYSVVAEGGVLEYNSAAGPPALYHARGARETPPLDGRDGYEAELAYFVDCCVGGRRPDRCPPEESVAAVKLARLMVEARDRRGEKIPCQI